MAICNYRYGIYAPYTPILTFVFGRTSGFAFGYRHKFHSVERTKTYFDTLREFRKEKIWVCAKKQ